MTLCTQIAIAAATKADRTNRIWKPNSTASFSMRSGRDVEHRGLEVTMHGDHRDAGCADTSNDRDEEEHGGQRRALKHATWHEHPDAGGHGTQQGARAAE